MAHQAVRAAGDEPFPIGQLDARAFLGDELGVVLRVVPKIRVSGPIAGLLEQHARLQAARGLAIMGRQTERLREDGAVGQIPGRPRSGQLGGARARQGEQPVGARAIVPRRGVDDVRLHAGGGPQRGHVGEEPGLAQARGEGQGRGLGGRSRLEPIQPIAAVIDDEDVALRRGAEAGDGQRGVDQLAIPQQLPAIVFRRPNPARRPVAIKIGAGELREARAAINEAARQRTELSVIMLDGRRREGRRAAQTVGEENARAFIRAPAVIGAAVQQMRALAEVLPVLSHPDLPALAVGRDAPGIAQSISPDLRARPRGADEGIVRRHTIRLSGRRAIDIQPQHLAAERTEVLRHVVRIEARRAVARRHIEHAIIAEGRRHAVVPIALPLDDGQRRAFDDAVRRLPVDRVAHDVGDLLLPRRIRRIGPHAADVNPAILRVARMEADAVGGVRQLNQRLRLGHLRPRSEAPQPAQLEVVRRVLQEQELPGPRLQLDRDGALRLEIGKRPHDGIRRRRLRRTDEPRIHPRLTFRRMTESGDGGKKKRASRRRFMGR